MQKGDWIGLIMVLVIVGGFGALMAFAPKAPELDFAPVDVGGGAIEMTVTGSREVLVSADLVKAGWVTVHVAMGPAPADVIGVSKLLPEGRSDVSIVLDRDMEPGLSYIALLHVDDGDGRFIELNDVPVLTNGVVVRSDVTYDPLGILDKVEE